MAMTLVAAFAGASFAGAWTRPANGLYDKLSYNFYYSHKNFDSEGGWTEMSDNGTFRDYNLSNYLEYGLTDNLTLINSLVFKVINKSDTNGSTTTGGVGDIDVAARYKLAEGKFGILSTQGLIKIPSGYSDTRSLPLGNGQVDLEAKLLYGRSLWPLLPGYYNVELGYRYRFGDPSDEFRYLVEVGFDFTKSIYGRVKLDGIMSVDNGEKYGSDGNPTTTNNFDLGKLELTAGYKLTPKWGLEFSYTPAVYGQNTAAGSTYALGLFYQTP